MKKMYKGLKTKVLTFLNIFCNPPKQFNIVLFFLLFCITISSGRVKKLSSEGDKTYSFDYLCAFILYIHQRKKDIKMDIS